MNKIGLFYGSDTGNTETIAGLIHHIIGAEKADIFDVYDVGVAKFKDYDYLIIGLSTWHDGQLVSAFDEIIDNFEKVDFTGKKIALFGLGDQFGYADYFIDAVGTLGTLIQKQGGELVGEWPTDDYDFDNSKADKGNGFFMGLALDEDNQDDLTTERLNKWIPQVLRSFE
tara:strand:+ start:130969 stop:131478 length:510 start_codon:yes stop_codon:yes gene_type:complete